MENTDLVLKTLNDSLEPLKSAQIAEISGIEKSLVDKAIKKLKTETKISSPKRCYYQAV